MWNPFKLAFKIYNKDYYKKKELKDTLDTNNNKEFNDWLKSYSESVKQSNNQNTAKNTYNNFGGNFLTNTQGYGYSSKYNLNNQVRSPFEPQPMSSINIDTNKVQPFIYNKAGTVDYYQDLSKQNQQQQNQQQQQQQNLTSEENKAPSEAEIMYMNYLQNLMNQANPQNNSDALKALEDYYNTKKMALQQMIPQQQANLDLINKYYQEAMAREAERAKEEKERIKDEYGQMLGKLARERREGEGRIGNMFASLGTLDSWGAGSHLQAQENLQSEFEQNARRILKGQQTELNEVERALQDFRGKTELEWLKAQQDAQNAINQIKTNIAMTDVEKKQAIANILGKLEEKRQSLQQQYFKFMMEMQKNNANELSMEFLTTGVPKTKADLEFTFKYPDKYRQILEGKQGIGSKESRNLTALKNFPNEKEASLLFPSGITGKIGYGARSGGSSIAHRFGYSTDTKLAQEKWTTFSHLLLPILNQEIGAGTPQANEAQMLLETMPEPGKSTFEDYKQWEEMAKSFLNRPVNMLSPTGELITATLLEVPTYQQAGYRRL